ncbi:MAG: 4-hydroxy-tetrahydrodipicolinate synthase [Armatimonadetes bacterium]|nr:4-hydroxy-tetrahydrodipicolinate synthase [Armatimonadota bacterium]
MSGSHTFEGLNVALATPFLPDGKIDLPNFRKLVQHVVSGGVDVLIPLGSTGEAATIADSERDELIKAALEEASGKPVVVGCGSNNTVQAIAWVKRAKELGAQGALVVTPPYSKPTLTGLVAHFKAITDAVPGFPIILYNVPSRTGQNITPAMLNELWKNPQIVAVKESSGNVAQIAEIARTLPAGKTLLCGDDNLALPAIAVGASGLVSVLGNALPAETKALVEAARAGRRDDAIKIHQQLLPFIDALFVESNPIPLKAVLHSMGIGGDFVRLPLAPASAETRAKLEATLKAAQFKAPAHA